MESTSISDVRRMCQCGAFRAYVQGGKVFLEDTATGQVVPLNGESGPANTERRAVPHREDRRGSRVERMFGARDTWKSADPDADQGPYRGFLIVQCEECGAIKAFCAKHETYGYKCGECGHETPLEKLRPLFMHCKCGKSFSYKTNLTAERVTHTCLACKAPVDLELNSRKTAYVTVGERRLRKWQRFCATTLALVWPPRARAILWAGRPPPFWAMCSRTRSAAPQIAAVPRI